MSRASDFRLKFALENKLRALAGLRPEQGLHPAAGRRFKQQAEAIAFRRQLIDAGDYDEAQIGLFAQEIGEGGKRQFLVDTYAGFALASAPKQLADLDNFRADDLHESRLFPSENGMPHLYEVVLDRRPCWLYFDLEYHTEFNPDLNGEEVMAGFRATLANFCRDVLGATLDLGNRRHCMDHKEYNDGGALLELDSSTPAKFSKHVLVKWLGGQSEHKQPLAFENNAQVGLVVREFLAYAHARKDSCDDPARHLFIREKPAANAIAAPSNVGHAHVEQNSLNIALRPEASLVDESVYSRNRCFRLLFHSKFGKTAALRLACGGGIVPRRGVLPAVQLLHSMASCVSCDIPFFRHPLVPPNFAHAALQATRLRTNTSIGRGCSGSSVPAFNFDQNGLARFLMEKWDSIRRDNEPRGSPAPERDTGIASAVEMDKRFMTVTLVGNRFCFCKGASHKSNHIYLVVDKEYRNFRQKCFDIDCKHFSSPTFEIPAALLHEWSDEEDIDEELLPMECGADGHAGGQSCWPSGKSGQCLSTRQAAHEAAEVAPVPPASSPLSSVDHSSSSPRATQSGAASHSGEHVRDGPCDGDVSIRAVCQSQTPTSARAHVIDAVCHQVPPKKDTYKVATRPVRAPPLSCGKAFVPLAKRARTDVGSLAPHLAKGEAPGDRPPATPARAPST